MKEIRTLAEQTAYLIVPAIQVISGTAVNQLTIPDEFWWACGSVIGIYSVGRTFEKRGASNKIVKTITGGNHII